MNTTFPFNAERIIILKEIFQGCSRTLNGIQGHVSCKRDTHRADGPYRIGYSYDCNVEASTAEVYIL